MELIEHQNMKGHFKIFTRSVGSKDWVKVVDKDNLILTAGRTFIRNIFSGQDTIYVRSFALGTSPVPPVVGDTGLGTAVPYSGSNIYKAFEEYTNDTTTSITFVGYWSSLEPVTQPVNITEVGLFTGLGTSAGTCYCRATFDAITKTTALELRLEYTITFA